MKSTMITDKPKIRKKEFEIKLLSENAVLPKKAVRGAIGYDLCLPNDFRVPAHSRVAIPLDIAINLPFGIEAKIEPRSGCSLRGIEGYGTRKVIKRRLFGIFPIAENQSGKMYFDADVCISKVDPNHPDTIHVIIINRDEAFLIRKGSRIAQLTFYQTIAPFFKQVEELTCENRGGGLGHTGTDRCFRRSLASEMVANTPKTPVAKSESIESASQDISSEIADNPQEVERSDSSEVDEDNYGAHV